MVTRRCFCLLLRGRKKIKIILPNIKKIIYKRFEKWHNRRVDTQPKIYETALEESDNPPSVKAGEEMNDKIVKVNLPLSQFAILSRKAASLGMTVEEMVAQNIRLLLSDK